MIELLILVTLLDEKCTIYKIRQNLEKKYGLFLNISFGSIHPAIKKLESKKLVSAKKSISQGGQRSSVYSITVSGKVYFAELMLDELPENPYLANQLINIKLMSINYLENEQQNIVKNSIINYLELKKISSKNLISNHQGIFDSIQTSFIKYNISKQNDFIEWIKTNI